MASERITWLGEQRVGASLVARIGRRGEELLAEFPGCGVLAANLSSSQASFEPDPNVDQVIVKKLTASLIPALLRHLQGGLTLHGSACWMADTAVAFVGPSGAGKSTLAAALCAMAGAELIADDTVALEPREDVSSPFGVDVLPTQSEVWLLPDARRSLGLDGALREKMPVTFRRPTKARLPLHAVVGLVFDSKARQSTIRPLRGHDALELLSSSVIRFLIDDPTAVAREFDQLRCLVQKCQVWELRRPRALREFEVSVELARRLYYSEDVAQREVP